MNYKENEYFALASMRINATIDRALRGHNRFKGKGQEHVYVSWPQSHVNDEDEKKGNNSMNYRIIAWKG